MSSPARLAYSLPPKYAKVIVEAIFDESIPNPIFRTLCKLLALAWERRYRETPEMTINGLADVCGLKERAMWNHLQALRKMPYVTVVSPRRGYYIIRFNFAFMGQEGQDNDEVKEAQLCPEDDDEEKAELRATLAQYVSADAAQRLVDTYKPERIQRQIVHYRWARREGKAAGPGWLIRAIENDWPLPPEVERLLAAEDPEFVKRLRQRYITGKCAEYIEH